MSHFSVLVVGNNPEAQLAPFQKFESSGEDNQYVKNVEQMAEARALYETYTTKRYRTPDGALIDPYQDIFFREPTPEDIKENGPFLGIGFKNGISWVSKDWHDGKPHHAKLHFKPLSYTVEDVFVKTIKSFAAFANGYYGYPIVNDRSKLDIHGDHKFGWILIDSIGQVIEIIKRTNPNAKWDFYTIGDGDTWSLIIKPGATGMRHNLTVAIHDDPYTVTPFAVDQARKGDVDWDAIIRRGIRRAIETWDKAMDAGPIRRSVWYGIDEDETKEHYVARQSRWSTFAVVKDGHWYERGQMGWWGVVRDEKDPEEWREEFGKLIFSLPDDTLLTVVDCHI